MDDKSHPIWPEVPCCMSSDSDFAGCICGREERSLRGWSTGRLSVSMTPEQREYCLQEIGRVEGYDRAEHQSDTAKELAGTVLSAWADYCRDKGLLI